MKFDDLIGGEGLSAEQEARLRRVHDLLVQAGPPPDLPPALERPAALGEAVEPPEIPVLFRRRRGLAAVLALAAALAVFAGGYAFGHSKSKTAAFVSERAVPMHGALDTTAVIRLGKADDVGNWPMLVEITGLPEQNDRAAYYELWLTRNDKPVAPCGAFRVHGKTTRVRFTVPYRLRGYDGWVVTAQPAHVHTPGRVVLTTT
jgi:hypothetical protein